jgi:Domain of unknown function (DUF4411)
MAGNLFSQPARYTIDTCSLIDIFSDEKMVSKTVTPGLWARVLVLIDQGIIISHVEVLSELKKDGTRGEELYDWAHANESVFRDHEWDAEGGVIRTMSPKYEAFVNERVDANYADPWLVAQAKCHNLTIISEEKFSNSPDVKKHKLPNVCADSMFNVGCIDLLGLIKEQNWTFK